MGGKRLEDKITVTMTTFKNRSHVLQNTIDSIINQVDEIRIYFNDYKSIPPQFSNNDKIICYLGSKCAGDIKAKGKFYNIEDINGYHLTIDDDIIYPKNYVKNLIEELKSFENKVVVTHHGKIVNNDSNNYYTDYVEGFHFQRKVTSKNFINIPGTGVFGYHTDLIKFNFTDIKDGRFVDLFIGIQLLKAKIPILLLEHDNNWLKWNTRLNDRHLNNLYDINRVTNHEEPTKLLNSYNWVINEYIPNEFNEENKDFSLDIKILLKKLKNNEKFSFSKYADGEYAILRNQTITNCDNWTYTSDIDLKYSDELLKSLKFNEPGYYIGISCPCCVNKEQVSWYRDTVNVSNSQLTWANIFVNNNYKFFKKEYIEAFKNYDIILVANNNANIENLPFDVEEHIKVTNTAWKDNFDLVENLPTKNYKDKLFLFVCGPLGNMLAAKMWEKNKNNTYLDIGSTLNPWLVGNNRGYLIGGGTTNKICVWEKK